MKIVILDGYTLNPGDLDWGLLESLGDLTVHDSTPQDEVVARALEAEIVVTNETVLTREQIESLPKLKYIGVLSTGFNDVDIEAARERGIPVTNIPGYGTKSVAQMVFAHLMALTRQVAYHSEEVRAGNWTECADINTLGRPQIDLDGLVLGLVGFGQIGREVSRLGQAFGMGVLAHTRNPKKYRQTDGGDEVEFVELEDLLRRSDVVSLHCPLTSDNERLIDRKKLALMKPTSFLINTGRGALINEEALAESLNEGLIAGAGLDVLSDEPPADDNPLFDAKNCFITPHIAWSTRGARVRLMEIAAGNLRGFLAGRPENVVN